MTLRQLFLGTCEDWLYKYLASIQLSSPAFEIVNIAPVLTDQFASALAWTVTPYGNLTVAWQNTSSRLRIDISVPVSVNATVTIPATSAEQVLEDGKHLGVQGIPVLETSANGVKVSVGSGQYSFAVLK
ncbi:hypothetical protein H0H87_003714 [Tephrocybe sp. NHM501043]|nr:hypothetical protein H0H87_003714 [Tephrocybe sp. NHM501043]